MPIPSRPFQRVGASSNTQVGIDFELVAQIFFESEGIRLSRNIPIEVGIGPLKKLHNFDLGCTDAKILVECKCHRWTSGHNAPSAKLTVWNEAMLYFHAAPPDYRKILFVLRDLRKGDGESLVSYYLRRYNHLVPNGVEFWEYCERQKRALRVGI